MDNLDNVFKILNGATAFIVVMTGFIELLAGFAFFIQGSFLLLFGSVIAALEITDTITPLARRYGSFLFSFLGRGVFYVFLSSLVFSRSVRQPSRAQVIIENSVILATRTNCNQALSIICGGLLMLLGFAYIALAFVPSINPPQ